MREEKKPLFFAFSLLVWMTCVGGCSLSTGDGTLLYKIPLKDPDLCVDVERLPDGNTLFVLPFKGVYAAERIAPLNGKADR